MRVVPWQGPGASQRSQSASISSSFLLAACLRRRRVEMAGCQHAERRGGRDATDSLGIDRALRSFKAAIGEKTRASDMPASFAPRGGRDVALVVAPGFSSSAPVVLGAPGGWGRSPLHRSMLPTRRLSSLFSHLFSEAGS